jgi:hypothetical protein
MERDGGFLDLVRLENLLLAIFVAVLALAPFPYGSNSGWAESGLGVGLGGVLLALSGLTLTGLTTAPSPIRRLVLPALCMIAALGWGLIQSIDLEAVVRLTGLDMRGLAHPVWASTMAALCRDTGSYVSVDPEATRHAVFVCCLSVSAFLIAVKLSRDPERARILLGGIVLIACAYAGTTVAARYVNVDLQALVLPNIASAQPPSARSSAPFMSANHLATFMTLGAIAGMGLFVETLRQATVWDRGSRTALRSGARAFGSAGAIWLIAATLVIATLVIAQSRGGLIALLVGTLALAIALAAGRSWSAGEENGRRAVTALLVLALGITVAAGIDSLTGRVADEGPDDTARAAVADASMKAIATAPLAGHGFGAFEHYYPLFAEGARTGTVTEASNDLLETLADLGLPAGFAFIATPILLAAMCFAGCVRRRRDRLYPAIGFAVSVAVAVHALVEFSLQIPAIAVTYAALLGIGVAQSWRTSMDAVR